jgi:hypothetical protein
MDAIAPIVAGLGEPPARGIVVVLREHRRAGGRDGRPPAPPGGEG